MPEGPEIETENLHETIKEELEKEGGGLLKTIALTTAFIAVFAAIAALKAGATVNHALFLKTEATQLQAKASDQWAYYQAKGIKAYVHAASQNAWLAAGKEPPEKLQKDIERYGEEQAEIKKEAQALEKERDAKAEESEHFLHTHHGYANAVTLFQVAIALGAVAALTKNRPVWWGSLVVGLAGLVLFGMTLLG